MSVERDTFRNKCSRNSSQTGRLRTTRSSSREPRNALPPVHRLALHTLDPMTYTPHPKPHTLHPTPYTLHPTPCTLHSTHHTRNPKPETRNPKLYTLHPTPRVKASSVRCTRSTNISLRSSGSHLKPLIICSLVQGNLLRITIWIRKNEMIL